MCHDDGRRQLQLALWTFDTHARNVRLPGGTLPIYDLAALAEAFDADTRQLDNLLSRNEIDGVDRRARGVTRRVTLDAAVTIRVALELATTLRVPFAHALFIAARVVRSRTEGLGSTGEVPVGPYCALRVDLPSLRRLTLEQLDAAVEIVGKRPRGRPPTKRQVG